MLPSRICVDEDKIINGIKIRDENNVFKKRQE